MNQLRFLDNKIRLKMIFEHLASKRIQGFVRRSMKRIQQKREKIRVRLLRSKMKAEIRKKKTAAKRIQDTFRWKRRQHFLLRLVRTNVPLSTVIKGVEKVKRKQAQRKKRKTTKKKEIDPTRWIECWDKVVKATFYYHLDEKLSVWDCPDFYLNEKVSLVSCSIRMEGMMYVFYSLTHSLSLTHTHTLDTNSYDNEDEPKEIWELQGTLRRGKTEFNPLKARVIAYVGDDVKEKMKEKEKRDSEPSTMARAPKKLTKEELYHRNKDNGGGGGGEGVGNTTSNNTKKEGTVEMKLYGEWRENGEITFTYLVRNAEYNARRRHRLRCANQCLSKWEYRLKGRVTQFKTFEGIWERRRVDDLETLKKGEEEENLLKIYTRGGRFCMKIVSSQELKENKKNKDKEENVEVLKLKLRKIFRDGKWITVNENGEIVVPEKLMEEKERLERERQDRNCTVCHKEVGVRLCHVCVYKDKEHHRYCLGCWDKRHRNVMHIYDALDPNECIECGGHAVLYCKQCEDQFCFKCWKNLHRAPGRRTHEIKRLSGERFVDDDVEGEDEKLKCGRCSSDNAVVVATRYCQNCKENFCELCFEFVHKKGKRKEHKFEGVNDFVIE